MRYSKILLAIVLISMLVFGSTLSAFAEENFVRPDLDKLKLDIEYNNNWGTITGTTEGWKLDGTHINLTAVPNTGYVFDYWKVKGGGALATYNTANIQFDIHKNTLCTAYFAKLYDLKVEVASGSIGMGTVTGSGKYKEGTDVLIKAIPNSGYAFVNWSIQYVHPEPSILEETSKMPMPDYTNPELMIHIGRCNIVATANFEPIPTHEVHLFVTPDGSGTAMFQGEDQSGIYMEGEDFTLIATPKPGFEFLYWSWEYCEHEGPEIGRAMATDLNLLVVIDPELTNPILTKEMGEMDMCFTAHFRPLSLVNVHYLDGMSVPLAPPVFLDGPIGSPYVTTAKVIEGYELTATPENATGFFGLEPIDVNYFYRPVETTEPSTEPSTEPTTAPSTEPTTAPTTAATTEDDTPTEPATIPTTASATTTAIETTEIITTEAVPLGAPELVNFDAIVEDSTLPPTEEIVEEVTEEVIPLADALPQTGQFPADLFYGIGGLISGLGVWLKRKK